MTKFTFQSGRVAGFAAEPAPPGEKFNIVSSAVATSDTRVFHVWMRHVTDAFLSRTGVSTEFIARFLVVLHDDNVADVYINDFNEQAEIQVNKDVKAGAPVFVADISDIRRMTFPDIEIKQTDAIVYGLRTEWRFSLYFDFRRALNADELALRLGALKREATFYASLAAADARILEDETDAFIFTEGKTDWKHLLSAARKPQQLAVDIGLTFSEEGYGGTDLLKMCEHCSRLPHAKPIIFIFDRDDETIMRQLRAKDDPGHDYQAWGNNVYSLYLPIPPGRSDETHSICIEFFYNDADIVRADESGRRLYLNTEFDEKTGIDRSRKLVCRDLNAIKRRTVCVVDHDVFDIESRRSVALSKDAFASGIYEGVPPFNEVDDSAFTRIFQIVATIVRPPK